MATTATHEKSPRERFLDAASELFYAEGVPSVGIDRVIARAGAAKASLYSAFASKEGLVSAYLERRHDELIHGLRDAGAGPEDPAERLLAVFDSQAAQFPRPGYRGCAFMAASAEAPGRQRDHRRDRQVPRRGARAPGRARDRLGRRRSRAARRSAAARLRRRERRRQPRPQPRHRLLGSGRRAR